MHNTKKLHNWLRNHSKFWLVFLAGGILRLLGIGQRTIWYDEAIAILRSRVGFNGILQGTIGMDPSGIVADQHPPGYFLALGAWIKVWGDSVPAARFFSIIFGILTIWTVYLISLELLGKKGAWIPTFFVAISPFHIHYSQEIRMYSLMTSMLTIATYAMLKGTQQPKWYWWVLFAFSSAAAQYSHHLSGVYLVCLAFIQVLRRDWRTVKNTFLGGLGAILLFSPWLLNLPNQIESTRVYWITKPVLAKFLSLLVAYFTGQTLDKRFVMVSIICMLSVIAISILIAIRLGKPVEEKSAFLGGWAAYLAFGLPLILWLVSQIWPVYLERGLVFPAVFFSVWVGILVSNKLTSKVEKGLLVGIMLLGTALGLWSHINNEPNNFYGEWEEIGGFLLENLDPEEIVVHSKKYSFVPMFYYFEDEFPQRFVADSEGSGGDTLRLPTQKAIGFHESVSIEDAVGNADGIWYIIYNLEYLAYSEGSEGKSSAPDNILWLESNFDLQGKYKIGEILIFHYKASS